VNIEQVIMLYLGNKNVFLAEIILRPICNLSLQSPSVLKNL